MGSIGSRQGEIKVIIPSRKEIRYCIKSVLSAVVCPENRGNSKKSSGACYGTAAFHLKIYSMLRIWALGLAPVDWETISPSFTTIRVGMLMIP